MAVDFKRGFFVMGIWGWAYAMNLIIKHTVRKPRPDAALRRIAVKGYSFASGHAVTSLALYFSIAKFFQPELAAMPQLYIAVMAMPFLLGLSRVYLRVHFWEDVIGGWTIAYAYFCFFAEPLTAMHAEWLRIILAAA